VLNRMEPILIRVVHPFAPTHAVPEARSLPLALCCPFARVEARRIRGADRDCCEERVFRPEEGRPNGLGACGLQVEDGRVRARCQGPYSRRR